MIWLRRLMEVAALDVTEEMGRRRCLILAPHQDDEVIGCGGTIATKVRLGAEVSIAFLTDGRRGFPAAPEDVRALREEEATMAAAALGLSKDHLAFLRFEDGQLNTHITQAVERIQTLIATLRVNDLFVPHRREFHPDHQAAWRIGLACCKDGMRLYEYPIWFGRWLRGWPQMTLRARMTPTTRQVKVDVAKVKDLKEQALSAYQSQKTVFARPNQWGPRFLANMYGDYELFLEHRKA